MSLTQLGQWRRHSAWWQCTTLPGRGPGQAMTNHNLAHSVGVTPSLGEGVSQGQPQLTEPLQLMSDSLAATLQSAA